MKKKTATKKPATKKTAAKRKPAAAKKICAPWKPKARALMLRTCSAQMTGHGGFKWPRSGYVEAPDWNPAPVCGGGLHGLLWGEGNPGYFSSESDAVWMVVEVEAGDVVSVDGDKVKVPRGNVVFAGTRHEAAAIISADPGSCGKACHYGTATAGNYGTATAGNYGTATAGYRGTATAGNYGTATAGDGGTATAGNYGTATAGDGGTVSIRYYDPKRDKYRVAIAEVGEDGIKPDTAYVVADGRLVEKPK